MLYYTICNIKIFTNALNADGITQQLFENLINDIITKIQPNWKLKNDVLYENLP